MRVGEVPLGAAVDPHVEAELAHPLGHCGRDLRRDRPFIDDRHVGQDDHPAVEGRHRHVHAERLDQHAQPPRWPCAGDREQHAALLQLVHRPDRPRGEHLRLRDKRAVHVRQDGGDGGPGSVGTVSHLVQLP
jgi:hypothetical protein